jgi:hypothetical protein
MRRRFAWRKLEQSTRLNGFKIGGVTQTKLAECDSWRGSVLYLT